MVSNILNKRKLYIGGEWIEGETGEWLDVENPATYESCAVVACASENDLSISSCATPECRTHRWPHP